MVGGDAIGAVPAFEAAEEGRGAHLQGANLAVAGHDLPEPGGHLVFGLGNEEEGGRVALLEFVDLRQAVFEVVDASQDLGFLHQFFGDLEAFLVVFAQAGHLGCRAGPMTGGDVERKGFVLGIGEVALHGEQRCGI